MVGKTIASIMTSESIRRVRSEAPTKPFGSTTSSWQAAKGVANTASGKRAGCLLQAA